MPDTSLTGKNALVTGASRGIGAAIAIELARKRATGVAITYLGAKEKADAVAAEVAKHGSKPVVIQADILDEDFGPKIVQQALKGLGTSTLDIIINNAALADLKAQQPFDAITPSIFKDVFVGNVYSAVSTTRAALPHLPASGGRIINISSIASREPNFDPVITYGASKAALDSFTRSLANKYAAEKKATFNSVSVGPTRTDANKTITETMPSEVIEQFKRKQTAEYRFGEPEDIAVIVAWLASEESRWINGASVPGNGGGMISVQG